MNEIFEEICRIWGLKKIIKDYENSTDMEVVFDHRDEYEKAKEELCK